MNRLTVTIFLTLCAFVQGCAFTKATLDVGLTEDAQMQGPLSSIDPVSIRVGEVTDARIDKERIGWKKNGYGANTADVVTSEPVEDVLKKALNDTLIANGHELGESGLTIESVLNNFWFEFDMNFWTVEVIGNMEAIFVLMSDTGREIYSNTYSGSYSEKRGGAGEKTWARVMSKALEALLEDFAFDEDLVEAIDSYDPDTEIFTEAETDTEIIIETNTQSLVPEIEPAEANPLI